MNAYTDHRACERLSYNADIEFSYFNKQRRYEAQMLNHSNEGMCFKSEISLQPGATVCIRVKNFQPPGARKDDCRGLRSVTLAEAKWCKEISNKTDRFYEIGAKYYQMAY